MRFGGPIGLGVLGAILLFAVGTDELGAVSLSTVGLILIIAAVVWLVLGMLSSATGRKTEATETVQHSDGSVEQKKSTVEHNDSI